MGYWGTKPAFLHRQTNKKNLISTAIPTLLSYKQISTLSKTSEIRAKQKKKEGKNFDRGFGNHKSNSFKEVLI